MFQFETFQQTVVINSAQDSPLISLHWWCMESQMDGVLVDGGLRGRLFLYVLNSTNFFLSF